MEDEFATAALIGMLAHQRRYKPRPQDPENWHEAIAKEAYEIADAMVAQASKRRKLELDKKYGLS